MNWEGAAFGQGVMLVRFSDTIKESFSNTVKSMDSIVAVLIISARGLLAVILLYNLTIKHMRAERSL